MSGPVYLGFDLSTQQLKCLAISSDLQVIQEVKWEFDVDSCGYDVHKGVMTNEDEGEVFAPVAMWLQAIDGVLDRLKNTGLDFGRIKGLSGAGMQHGSVFWDVDAERILSSLNASSPLEGQMANAFAHQYSPNWQDASTQAECDAFDHYLGNAEALSQCTGSKAHHRFTGPQIMRFMKRYPERYKQTGRISLVSSWFSSVFLGRLASIDISDVCGMNLWDIMGKCWNENLLKLCAGVTEPDNLKAKLGGVPEDGGMTLGTISKYFVQRYGFPSDCKIVIGTGDNPATILALPLRPNEVIISLGTSSTFLMSTKEYKPDPAYHLFGSPTTYGHFMFMLCYKNGSLAREKVRDLINESEAISEDQKHTWTRFDHHLLNTPPLARRSKPQENENRFEPMNLGIYFPRHEIVPNAAPGEWHYTYDPSTDNLEAVQSTPNGPLDDARIIVESQFLSMRLRSQALMREPSPNLPPQPTRIYLVGGGSKNKAIAKIAGEVLGGAEGVYKLDVGENACALGAAQKAVWGCERQLYEDGSTESFEELIGKRWQEADFVEKIAEGYQADVFEQYGKALRGFKMMEEDVTNQEGRSK